MNESARSASLFKILGIAFDWNSYQIAGIYRVTVPQLEIWLRGLDFTTDELKELRERKAFETGNCRCCGMTVSNDSIFCSNSCRIDYAVRKRKLVDVINTNRIFIGNKYKSIYYNITTGRVDND